MISTLPCHTAHKYLRKNTVMLITTFHASHPESENFIGQSDIEDHPLFLLCYEDYLQSITKCVAMWRMPTSCFNSKIDFIFITL